MKKLKSYFKWFTWRFMPNQEELSVKSILETVLYLLVFVVCWFLFIFWNDVPIRKDTIHVDCLIRSKEYREQSIAPTVKICYCIPMTSVGWQPEDENTIYRLSSIDTENHKYSELYKDSVLLYTEKTKVKPGISFDFGLWTTSSRKDDVTNVVFVEPYNSPEINDSIKKDEKRKNLFWMTLFDLGSDFPYNYTMPFLLHKHDNFWKDKQYADIMYRRYLLHQNMINSKLPQRYDSLQNEFVKIINKKRDKTKTTGSFYYVSLKSLHYNRWIYPSNPIESDDSDKEKITVYKQKNPNRRESEHEIYASNDPQKKNTRRLKSEDSWGDNIFEKPSWFRLEDISQVYYDLQLESLTMDSIILKFEFVGATEFSTIKPVPDKITMSSIEFSDPQKILDIKLNGLKFHARFKELENKQYIRVFVVSQIIGGLILIFIALVFSGIIRLILNNKKDNKTKTTKNQ